jgi:hypothetical protein
VLKINRLARRWFVVCAIATTAVLALPPHRGAHGQDQAQGQGQAREEAAAVSHGENFSAKPAPALFASDCTGGDCHKSAQGLAKGQSQTSLAGFLRAHYTNSRESAAALAAYLLKLPNEPAPKEAHAPKSHPSARSSRASARSEEAPAKPAARAQSGSRSQRARRSAAAPPMPPEPPAPPEPPPPPPPKKFDIFD